MKKLLRITVLLLLICILFSGCSKTDDQTGSKIVVTDGLEGMPVLAGDIPVTFPLTSDPTTLNILITGYDGLDQETVYVWKKYEEMTGIDVNWTTVTRKTRAEALHTALTNQQNLDLILRCKISANRLTQYGEGGLILDLAKDDLLKT